jgi:hypothetical protein
MSGFSGELRTNTCNSLFSTTWNGLPAAGPLDEAEVRGPANSSWGSIAAESGPQSLGENSDRPRAKAKVKRAMRRGQIS